MRVGLVGVKATYLQATYLPGGPPLPDLGPNLLSPRFEGAVKRNKLSLDLFWIRDKEPDGHRFAPGTGDSGYGNRRQAGGGVGAVHQDRREARQEGLVSGASLKLDPDRPEGGP